MDHLRSTRIQTGRWLLTFGVALSLLVPELPAQASSDSSAAGPSSLTAVDLETFLDGVVPLALKTNDVAGAVIAVVKDGRLLLAKGYGYSNLALRAPVDPDATLFRVASISKLFNAVAVMQLVEQGTLSLDEDITRYLDFELPRRHPDPITLRHLLTHTAGFEEAFKQLPADSGQGVPLRDWIVRTTPPQLYRPGTVTSYSNYGADLAGYIVQHASGMPFAEYVRTRILEPLGMRRSSIAQPLPPDLASQVSEEYPTASDSVGEFEILQGEPSGNLSATAADMARFALALLGRGTAPDSTRILSAETMRLMYATQFRTHPEVPGMGLGFFEEDRHGYRIVGHGGDLSRFHSHLSLLLDEGVGFFISVNSSGSGPAFFGAREAVRDAFLDRYFPRKTPLEPVVADKQERARAVTGSYTISRRGESGISKLAAMAIDVDISANPDGSIQIGILAGPNGRPMRWWPVGTSTFRNADGSQLIGYLPAADGLPDRFGFLGGHELHRVGTADSRVFNQVLLGLIVGGLALPLLLWPLAALVRRRYGAAWRDDGVGRRLRIATRVAALAAVASIGVLVAFFVRGDFDSRTDWMLALVRVLAVVGALGAAAAIAAFALSLRRGSNRWAQLKYLVVVLASLAFIWFGVHWHLLGTSFRY